MILSAERAILDDPTLPLTYLVSRAADFELLLPALLRMANEVEENKVHGCKLLDLVSQHACNGVPIVRSCIQRILARCFMVFYAQVSAWAVHGMLSDPHDEFCVRPAPAKNVQRKAAASEVPARKKAAGADTPVMSGYSDEQHYLLFPEMKPSVLSAAVAEKVLFCGVAMHVVMQPRVHADERPEPHVMSEFNDKIKDLAGALEFHRASFEGVVDEIHTYLSRRLWSLVMERARLPKHLRAIKDYFLLARGDLFQAFIDNTRGLLALPPSETLDHDVNEPFRRAALLSYADDDEFFSRTRLAVEHSDNTSEARRPGTQSGEEEEGLDRLRMHYEMEWPLGALLFTADVMKKYNELFSFLLRVKRAKTELQQAWLETQSGRNGRALSSTAKKGSPSTRHMVSMWALRAEMAFLVNNLLYYLQCDVLDTQFQVLKEAMDASDSFETIRVAHAKFVDHILLDCLTYNKLTWTTVNTLLRIALKFARRMCQFEEVEHGEIQDVRSSKVLQLAESATPVARSYVGFPITVKGESTVVTDYSADRWVTVYKPLTASVSGDLDSSPEDLVGVKYSVLAPAVTPEELAETRHRFQRNASLLFSVLKTSQTHTTPVLSQLLLRMDYNQFFERTSQQRALSVRKEI